MDLIQSDNMDKMSRFLQILDAYSSIILNTVAKLEFKHLLIFMFLFITSIMMQVRVRNFEQFDLE